MWGSSAGEVPAALAATLGRLADGFTLGALVGIPCGLLAGRLRRLRRWLETLPSMLRGVPLLALLPALMLLLGSGRTARVAVVGLSCFLLVARHTVETVWSIDPAFARLARTYGATGLALWRRVYLPSALPGIFTGLRLALTTGWGMAVCTELVEPRDGLGGMILAGWRSPAPEQVSLGVLLCATVAIALHAALRHFEEILFPWRRGVCRALDGEDAPVVQTTAER